MLINNKKYGIYILAKFIYIIAFIKKIKTTTWEKKKSEIMYCIYLTAGAYNSISPANNTANF